MTLRTLALATCVAFVPAALLAAPVLETFEPGPSALHGIVKAGTDGPWTIRLDDGTMTLRNEHAPQTVKFYRVDGLKGEPPLADAKVGIDVGGTFAGRDSAVGLLYRYDPASRTYLAFVVGEKSWSLFERDAQRLARRMRGNLPEGNGPMRHLEIGPDGDNLALRIDGHSVGQVRINDLPGSSVGLIAMSTGTFHADNLSIVPAGS
jgi:hypothetical protein